MQDFVRVNYARSGESQASNKMGMRAMQARVFQNRHSQYLLVKAPPASGKSRALMFIGLDKLENQGIRKVVVAVPERSIGSSFKNTNLTEHGFFRDWQVEDEWNLCKAGGAKGKVQSFLSFMDSDDEILVCTHSTLRFAFDEIIATKGIGAFDDCLLAIDEFHHVSADATSKLGELVRLLIQADNAHLVAMTGSYFRGDATPVLRPEDEEKFNRVSYTYYEQLNGYKHLKTLGIGYHFYRGRYIDAINEILDPAKKTIVHIPHVGAAAALGNKYDETDRIIDHLGDILGQQDPMTGFYRVQTKSGAVIKVADLVTEDGREKVIEGLRTIEKREDLDVIIALGMAKEGFDWIWCEHALTIGYKGSLTEVIQIIGRTTRDAPGKEHAQFTNLIAEPDATQDRVTDAVNNMLKAIAASLLMEQVLAPNFKFKTHKDDDEIDGSRPDVDIATTGGGPEIAIKGFKEPSSDRVKQIIESDIADLTAAIFQNEDVLRAAMNPDEIAPEVVNQVFIPKVIEQKYKDLTEEEIEEIRQHVVANAVFTNTNDEIDDEEAKAKKDLGFVRLAEKFINLDDLDIDLIDSINPFQLAYEVMSKSVDAGVLSRIHQTITAKKIAMSKEEAEVLYPRIKKFHAEHGREPDLASQNPMEKRMAEALAWIREAKRKKKAAEMAAGLNNA